jgi:hypothetical protein
VAGSCERGNEHKRRRLASEHGLYSKDLGKLNVLFMFHLTTLSVARVMVGGQRNDELENIWAKAVAAYFTELFRNSLRGTQTTRPKTTSSQLPTEMRL